VDDELRRAEAYFTRLLEEIREAAAITAKTGYTVRTAEMAVEAVQRLRHELAQEQETQQPAEQYQAQRWR
jgi:hypothetical protein